jgi:hypothetical protein
MSRLLPWWRRLGFDLDLPDGPLTLQKLHATNPDSPIIGITAAVESEMAVVPKSLGVAEILRKPVSLVRNRSLISNRYRVRTCQDQDSVWLTRKSWRPWVPPPTPGDRPGTHPGQRPNHRAECLTRAPGQDSHDTRSRNNNRHSGRHPAGPKIRLRRFVAGKCLLRTGAQFTITTAEMMGDETCACITYPAF